jgi:hypothetical protein
MCNRSAAKSPHSYSDLPKTPQGETGIFATVQSGK